MNHETKGINKAVKMGVKELAEKLGIIMANITILKMKKKKCQPGDILENKNN
ncbi:helix-turn-helix transcriptional regulator [Lysinibacillus sp. CTST325]